MLAFAAELNFVHRILLLLDYFCEFANFSDQLFLLLLLLFQLILIQDCHILFELKPQWIILVNFGQYFTDVLAINQLLVKDLRLLFHMLIDLLHQNLLLLLEFSDFGLILLHRAQVRVFLFNFLVSRYLHQL